MTAWIRCAKRREGQAASYSVEVGGAVPPLRTMVRGPRRRPRGLARLGSLPHNGGVTDHQDPGERPERPERAVVSGLVALLAVALVVGLIMGGVALAATRVLGISGGGGGSSAADASEKESLYLPRPVRTTATDPLITLDTERPETDDESEAESDEPSESESTSEATKDGITLQAGQTEVSEDGRIDLSGVYPGGEGQVLQVQRFENGAWSDFPATIPVSGKIFTTYIFTGVTGENRIRVVDNQTGETSNEVKVQVG